MFLTDPLQCVGKWAVAALFVCFLGCERDMADQPHVEPLEPSTFFADGQSSRPLVEGTVARGHLRVDTAFFEGKTKGELVEDFPLRQTANHLQLEGNDEQIAIDILDRGQQRYDIFCAACHDRTGTGEGMVVKRGFTAPPSFHSERLREAPVGHFYDVITSGWGRMPDYADQIPPADRWAIVAYVKALQLSQYASVSILPEAERSKLQSQGTR